MSKKSICICCAILLAFCSTALAEDAAPEKNWSDEAEFSYVSTSGNSQTTTLAGKNLLKYKFTEKIDGEWDIAALFSEDRDITTAERYSTNIKGSYLLTEHLYTGLAAGWMKDRFAGFDSRYYVGPFIGNKFYNGPKHFLKGELGINYAHEEYIDDTDESFGEGSLYGLYEYLFTEKTKFSQAADFLYDFNSSDNWKFLSLSAITVSITEIFSIKASYEYRYVNRPVPDTLDTTDTTVAIALVANL